MVLKMTQSVGSMFSTILKVLCSISIIALQHNLSKNRLKTKLRMNILKNISKRGSKRPEAFPEKRKLLKYFQASDPF